MKSSTQFSKTCLWAGLLASFCLWTGCSAVKTAHVTPADTNVSAAVYSAADAPQAAQSAATFDALPADNSQLTASSEPIITEAVALSNASALTAVGQNPQLSRKVTKLMNKVQNQSVAGANDNVTTSNGANRVKFAKKLLAKVEKRMDITKAKEGNAAQANTTLVGLGALLAIVGLVLVLATSGTAATIGVVSLAVGVILLILSLISN